MQGYAWEITTAEGGWGLDKVLQSRQHVLNGITNGIDMDEWDPEADEHTVAAYSAEDLSGKAACKEALQKELGLEINLNVSDKLQRLLRAASMRSMPSPDCTNGYLDVNNSCQLSPHLKSYEAKVLEQKPESGCSVLDVGY